MNRYRTPGRNGNGAASSPMQGQLPLPNPNAEPFLNRLERRCAALEWELAGARLETEEDRWWHEQLADLVERIEELIAELRQNYTIVIVTHNMQQAARVSDQTAFFWMGKLIEFSNTAEMFTNPKTKHTEDYITGRFG